MPSVLALHGFMGRGADWTPVATRLGEAADVLAPDLAGHGSARDLPADPDTEADRLAALLDRPAVVAGYSMGGRLALHLAARHPEAVSGLVLVSAAPGLRDADVRVDRRATDTARAREIADDYAAFLDRWYRMPLWGGLDEPMRQHLVRDRLGHNDPAALGRALRGLGPGGMAPLWDSLSRIRVPAVAVAGTRDTAYVTLAHEMARCGPVRAVLVPDAGHALLAEAPHAVADAIRRVLPS
ncbi:MAG: alpha/beta fold hydrolase [Bacteroidota bacterium]